MHRLATLAGIDPPTHHRRGDRHPRRSPSQLAERHHIMIQTTFNVFFVPDITCGHCEQVITKALMSVEGVERVAVDIPARHVQVDYDPARVDVERMTAILADEDYPVERIVTSDEQQPAVPAAGCSCCTSSH